MQYRLLLLGQSVPEEMASRSIHRRSYPEDEGADASSEASIGELIVLWSILLAAGRKLLEQPESAYASKADRRSVSCRHRVQAPPCPHFCADFDNEKQAELTGSRPRPRRTAAGHTKAFAGFTSGGVSTSSDESVDADEGEGPLEETTAVAPDGSVITVTFRGVDPALPTGSKEWKKAKRLADNRASAARSRALARLRVGDMGVSSPH